MRIIPVMDLKGGQVTRGVGGRREEYRPIRSSLCEGASPAAVAAGFRNRLGFLELYLADLDAIAGAEPAWAIYESLLDWGHELIVDAGVSSMERAGALRDFTRDGHGLSGVIVGLETTPHPDNLSAWLDRIGQERLIFSLDLKHGQAFNHFPAWRDWSPRRIADEAISRGIRRLIVLDLARVGEKGGVGGLELCRELAEMEPPLELIAGGGVRGVEDLVALEQAGCAGALVASALHDGVLGPSELRPWAEDVFELRFPKPYRAERT